MKAYRRAYAQVDLGAIRHNTLEIRSRVGQNVKIMQVIKADAYGHGAVPVAHALNDLADYFAVALIEEAMELRKNGIIKPILVFGFVAPELYADVLLNNVTQTVFRYEMAEKLSIAAAAREIKGKIHICVDTGMSRLGFDCSDASIGIIKKIAALKNIEIEGIYTHFATADEGDNEFIGIQSRRFGDVCRRLREQGVEIPVKHICNSAGLICNEENYFDMVRPGIVTYGLYPSDDVDKKALNLKPSLSFKTHVVHIKTLPKGVGVSYGLTYVTDKETVVATIPVGYADGYPRSLSNKGRVLVRGQYAPIIGRVCMDQFMIDVTNIKDVKINDDVTLIGTDGGKSLAAEEVAVLADTINYEIVCGIGKRVPRVYI